MPDTKSSLQMIARSTPLMRDDWVILVDNRIRAILEFWKDFSIRTPGESIRLRSAYTGAHRLSEDEPSYYLVAGGSKLEVPSTFRGIFSDGYVISRVFDDRVGYTPDDSNTSDRGARNGVWVGWCLVTDGPTDEMGLALITVRFAGIKDPTAHLVPDEMRMCMGTWVTGYEKAYEVEIELMSASTMASRTKVDLRSVWTELGRLVANLVEHRAELYERVRRLGSQFEVEQEIVDIVYSSK